ncbi:MAG: hypothetical protein JXQ99_24075 [Hyphomicrobiaceae bacterium]
MSFKFGTVVLLAIGLFGGPAIAETKLRDVSIKGSGSRGTFPGIRTLVVTGRDGRYRAVESANLNFGVKIKARVTNVRRSFKIYEAMVSASLPRTGGGKSTNHWSRSFLDTKDGYPRKFDRSVTFRLPQERLGPVAKKAVDLCNQRLVSNRNATNGFERRMKIVLSLSVRAGRQATVTDFVTTSDDIVPSTRVRRSSQTDVDVIVTCKPISDKREIEIATVNLIKTSKGQKCPQTWELQAVFKSNRSGAFQISRRTPGVSSKLIRLTLKKGKGKGAVGAVYRATYRHKLTLDHAGQGAKQIKFKVVVENGPSSNWVIATIRCAPRKVTFVSLDYKMSSKATCPKRVTETVKLYTNRPGPLRYRIKDQGGLILYSGNAEAKLDGNQYVATARRNFQSSTFNRDLKAEHDGSPANSGWKSLNVDCLAVNSAKLELLASPKQTCPRKVFATATYLASGNGRFKHSIRCNGGRQIAGYIKAKKVGNRFQATATLPVTIKKSETLKCIARAENFATKATYAVNAFYKCGSSAGSGSVAVGPGSSVDPGRRAFKGSFQYVDRNRSKRCPRRVSAVINFYATHDAPVRWSLDCGHGNYSGVAKVRRNAKGQRIAPALVRFNLPKGKGGFAKIRCALKTSSPGKRRLHTALGRDFRCVNPTTGSPQGGLETPTSSSTGRRRDGATRVICQGGRVRQGRCICGAGRLRRQTASKQFACIARPRPTPQKITCRGGTVRGGVCICGPNQQRQVLSPRAFVCKRKPRIVACVGGRVVNNRCRCPRQRPRLVRGRCIQPAQ